ncbi:hypothetical protein TIFTF001_051904 [Ficus carica]|uniref:Uncharacterized protein n=1 Tax=Ficus carica TaxID=3494 RepID=A0AA88EF69_FICCA|nr:hypothetical protein TIFTF001_051904 [Ficus carica]
MPRRRRRRTDSIAVIVIARPPSPSSPSATVLACLPNLVVKSESPELIANFLPCRDCDLSRETRHLDVDLLGVVFVSGDDYTMEET